MSATPSESPLVRPIEGPAPVGKDLTYDPSFEALSAEIEKSTSLTGQLPDFRLILTESARILAEQAKDLRVAGWFVAAKAQVDGWPGALDALGIYRAIVEQYWDTMFPPAKRARARGALVGWLWEQLARALAAKAPVANDGEALRAFEPALTELDGVLASKLGDANPGIGALRSVAREKLRDLPAPPAAKPEPGAATTTGASDDAAAGPRSVAGPPSAPRTVGRAPSEAAAPPAVSAASLDEAEAIAGRWRDGLSTLARHARQAAPTSPWPYRLTRISAWLVVETAPDVEAGKTFIRGPRPTDREGITALAGGSDWEALRDQSEDALSEHIFWLDLHRMTAIALERLGPAYRAARDAVGREIVSLVRRVPTLPQLLFSNGTPFASPETALWIKSEEERFGGGGGATAGGSEADTSARALVDETRERLASGQIDEALGGALRAADALPSARARFHARLELAKLAATTEKSAVALAIYERLLPEVNETLEAWEPSACADLIESYLRALRSSDRERGGVADENREMLLLRRLLGLDPAAALRAWA